MLHALRRTRRPTPRSLVARRTTQQALKADPTADVNEALARAYIKGEQYMEAAEAALKAVTLDPSLAKAYLRRGCAARAGVLVSVALVPCCVQHLVCVQQVVAASRAPAAREGLVCMPGDSRFASRPQGPARGAGRSPRPPPRDTALVRPELKARTPCSSIDPSNPQDRAVPPGGV